MSSSRLTHWKEIEKLSLQISELAHQEDWEKLPKVELERRQLLELFFSEPVSLDIAPEIAAGIKNIQHSDAELIQLVQKSRKNIAHHLAEIAKGKQVIEAYTNNR
jgi:hypothetical protein